MGRVQKPRFVAESSPVGNDVGMHAHQDAARKANLSRRGAQSLGASQLGGSRAIEQQQGGDDAPLAERGVRRCNLTPNTAIRAQCFT